ncbi:M20/M25/M40 family metallo-hydrolase [Virgibacillus sp. MG-45]|uniref:M20/M25/M40 family metallo-hydrolase n=1 Tax=Virgibacillus sp. MG-45 TaxID=3102791 RepID=UPI002EDB038A
MDEKHEWFDCREELLALTKQLVRINSIVNTEGEKVIAHSIFTYLSALPYYTENPTHLTIEQTIGDELERYNVLAFVKGTKGTSNRTVVLMGHMDTVGVDDFNQQQDFAFDPDAWMEFLRKEELSGSVKDQLESGDWLFGRGVLDMKSGIASNLYLLSHYATHPEQLDGNIVFLAECDEEDSSNGILSSLKTLKHWREDHDFDYVAAINSDFVAPAFEGDENRYVYKGTVGKLLPSFFITGDETHVGSCFDGLDPNFIASELTRQINYNPDLCDVSLGERTVPPVSLKQTDLKPTYTVQTALSAFVYYNFFVHSWTPEKVLALLKDQAEIAFQNALELFQARYEQYCSANGQVCRPLPWKPRVFTYEEMDTMLVSKYGESYSTHMEQFKQDLLYDETLDIRMFAARVIEEAWRWMEDKSPAIFVFYSSLYSPRVALTGKDKAETNLIQALDQAVSDMQDHYRFPIKMRNFFPHISDMSFIAMSDAMEDIAWTTKNNPAWGTKLYANYEDIQDLNIPVINVGPYGMDGHKKLERMEMTYSLEIVPNLTNRVIQYVLQK